MATEPRIVYIEGVTPPGLSAGNLNKMQDQTLSITTGHQHTGTTDDGYPIYTWRYLGRKYGTGDNEAIIINCNSKSSYMINVSGETTIDTSNVKSWLTINGLSGGNRYGANYTAGATRIANSTGLPIFYDLRGNTIFGFYSGMLSKLTTNMWSLAGHSTERMTTTDNYIHQNVTSSGLCTSADTNIITSLSIYISGYYWSTNSWLEIWEADDRVIT